MNQASETTKQQEWKRFENAVGALLKTSPKPKTIKKEKPKKKPAK